MPMGIVTESEWESEISEGMEIRPLPTRGRPPGRLNVPNEIRQEIAEINITEGRGAALDKAKELGISSSSVSAYSKGATSTTSYHTPSQSLIDHINKSRKRHVKKASHKLGLALDEITPEKLEGMRAKDLASVARDMAGIIKNLEPPNQASNEGPQAPQFIIYAPSFRAETTYEVIPNVDE